MRQLRVVPLTSTDPSREEAPTWETLAEPEARRWVFERYAGLVERTLLRTMGPDRDMADLIHDAFIQIFSSLDSLDDPKALPAWIVRVSSRVAIDALRYRRRRRWLRYFSPLDVPAPVTTGPDHEHRATLRAFEEIMQDMAPEDRVAFALRYLEEMTVPEVAHACACSEATAKRRIQRAQALLVARAEEHELLRGWLAETEKRGTP